MTFKQGKFYEGDQVVPLEHGNSEQIDLLTRISTLRQGIVYGPYSQIVCPCGSVKTRIFDEGKIFECECGSKYEFFIFDDHVPCVKLLK
jgi:hypothetical protein